MNASHKKIYIVVGIVAVLLIVFFANQVKRNSELEVLAPGAQCKKDLAVQKKYLEEEKLSSQYTFGAYPVPLESGLKLSDLDVRSSQSASEFRTKLSAALADTGVNFAGHYSIVSVGMTGWGENYWIVDRTNGRAYEFPYHAASLDFRRDSNLIVMNSKQAIGNILAEQSEANCYFLNQQKISDLRPFYFVWKDNTLQFLGPTDMQPPINKFWSDYFGAVVPGRLNLTGVYSCLPLRDSKGPQDTDCKGSLKTDEGDYYALDFNLSSRMAPNFTPGDRISAGGVFTPIEMLSTDMWRKYQVKGIFSVTDFVVNK